MWLKFDAFPIWLLVLDANLVSQVGLIGFPSLDALTKSTEVVFSQKEYSSQEALHLVSGSGSFVNDCPQTCHNPTLVLCDEHIHSQWMAFLGLLQWSWLRYQDLWWFCIVPGSTWD
jgi:hypothetical protein